MELFISPTILTFVIIAIMIALLRFYYEYKRGMYKDRPGVQVIMFYIVAIMLLILVLLVPAVIINYAAAFKTYLSHH